MKAPKTNCIAGDIPPFGISQFGSAWNSPSDMVSSAIALQVLKLQNPGTITKVNSVLENQALALKSMASSSRLLAHWNKMRRD